MKINFLVQTPKSPVATTLGHLLQEKARSGKYEEALISVAYMTIAGVRSLLSGFSPLPPPRTKWLIGLDDFVTQPGALDVIFAIPGAEVRVISYSSLGVRFHPKVYILQKQSAPKIGFTIVGSANLTAQALAGNGEASAIFQYENAADFLQVREMWDALWSQGHKPTTKELVAYKAKYDLIQKSRPKQIKTKRASAGIVILASDDAELDPGAARLCWIECGHITAMGREIELKAEQGIFFGLNPTGEQPKHFAFVVSSGISVQLRMKFQGNHMWRLQLTRDVPEVASGLRPVLPDGSLGRSPYAAIIERTHKHDVFKLRFIDLNSIEFKKIVKKSIELGTYGKTTARQYGWC